ncbi:MAG: hypothetical protein HC913_14775 [Microscillaceae bacterium]|nr:hypothetical protein [Microscillaceae bacterium]
MRKLVIVSNRLPVTIKVENDNLLYYPSAGGLATGLNSVAQNRENLWIGWPGLSIEEAHQQAIIREDLKKQNMFPVFLSEEDFHLYYEGFSNKVIWPHFHYFTQYTQYEEAYWQTYQSVNAYFAEVICEHLQGDELVWVHDYHLMLLPALIRAKFPDISIGFFLHIPFPSYEIFRILPWREDLLNGLLGADLVGFHTFSYMRHFLSCVYRLAGYEHDIGYISKEDRLVHVDVFPMGIDYEKFAAVSAEQPDTLLKTIRQKHPRQKSSCRLTDSTTPKASLKG